MYSRAFKFFAAVVAIASICSATASVRADPIDQDEVRVTIQVLPYAEFSAPGAGGFKLTVKPLSCPPLPRLLPMLMRKLWALHCHLLPGWYAWPPVAPARLPFTVQGNAMVQVSVAPDSFLRSASGRYLGRAEMGNGAPLGYHALVHFPAPSASYQWVHDWDGWDDWHLWHGWAGFGRLPFWSRIAHLPGTDGDGTLPLKADLAERHFKANGVIYAVARRSWTPSGAYAAPGDYYGAIIITVTAE